MKRCTSAKPESSGSGSSGSIGRDSEIARPLRIEDAAASLPSSVIRLSVPIRSSSPHLPQLDNSDKYVSTPTAVSPVFSVTAVASGIWTSYFELSDMQTGLEHVGCGPRRCYTHSLISASRFVFSREHKSRAREVVLQNTSRPLC